ncbi:hypothetical protein PGT21_009872 [Puccinia graminis f. sp. tritici]|uniref:Uncharacterized protein n=1 Tax=Puccinia graminis f. sp. tritici TaxID=56615 RepID=A0A5B0NKD4_PUCGR|nr:hypothetical protein PGT21_009872 [Puccinia graminis f. sp. tritici]
MDSLSSLDNFFSQHNHDQLCSIILLAVIFSNCLRRSLFLQKIKSLNTSPSSLSYIILLPTLHHIQQTGITSGSSTLFHRYLLLSLCYWPPSRRNGLQVVGIAS